MPSSPDYLAIFVCSIIISITLIITFVASRRSQSDSDFFAAGRSIKSWQNGLAIAGEFLSAGSFLGTTGLIFFYGVDGGIILAAGVVSFLPVLFFLAERMRNVGRYTLADVLSFRNKEGPIRTAAALSTFVTGSFVLMAQLVAAGVLLQSLSGIPFTFSIIATGTLMAVYVFFGGMLATTWVQVIKSAMLCILAALVALGVLHSTGYSLPGLIDKTAAFSDSGMDIFKPGLLFSDGGTLNLFSYGLTYALGTAGLAHILIRFFTVPDAKTARRSLGWTVAVVSGFYLVVLFMGFGAIAVLGSGGSEKVGGGGNLAAPALVAELGGGEHTLGGSIALAIVSAVAFASIVAVVAGVVISSAGTLAHDLWPVVSGRYRSRIPEAKVARVAAVGISIVAIIATIGIGDSTNITFLMGMAFMVGASAHLPSLLLSLSWRRFNTVGAVSGIFTGLIATIVTLLLTPALWFGDGAAPLQIDLPVVITAPLGIAACIIGTLCSRRASEQDQLVADERFAEMTVRAETGIGAEIAG